MRDIPVFTTEHGAASLLLREIPYRRRAHIKLQATQDPEQLLQECVAFCRACGAEWIDAAGHPYLEKYPLITSILWMQRSKDGMEQSDASLFPVTEKTAKRWQELYNLRMENIPNSAYLDDRGMKELMPRAYFIHRNGTLLGLGSVDEDKLETVISVIPGEGKNVVQTLSQLISGDTVKLQVALANERAVRLYEKLGFVPLREQSRWYRIL